MKRKSFAKNLNAHQLFFQGGDELLHVLYDVTSYTVWTVLKPHFKKFCERQQCDSSITLDHTFIIHDAKEEIIFEGRANMCHSCTLLSDKNNKHLQPQCICTEKSPLRLTRPVYAHMKVMFRDNSCDEWELLKPQVRVKPRSKAFSKPFASTHIATTANTQHVMTANKSGVKVKDHDQTPIAKCCGEQVDIQKKSKPVSQSTNVIRMSKHVNIHDIKAAFAMGYNISVQTKHQNEFSYLVEELSKMQPNNNFLVLSDDANQTSQNPNICFCSFDNAIKRAYGCDQHSYDDAKRQSTLDILENMIDVSRGWDTFNVICVFKTESLHQTLHARFLKRVMSWNRSAKLVLLRTRLFDPSKVLTLFCARVQHIFTSASPWHDMSSRSVSTLLDSGVCGNDEALFKHVLVTQEVLHTSDETCNLEVQAVLQKFPNCENLIGSIVPLSYKHKSCPRRFFKTIKLINTQGCHTTKFQKLRDQESGNLTPNDIAFMYLCYYHDTSFCLNKGELLKQMCKEDWLSPLQSYAFPLFANNLKLQNQEQEVFKDGLYGQVDGFSIDEEVIELKFKQCLNTKDKLQTLLYHSMQTVQVKNSCILCNYRTGEIVKLVCLEEPKMLFYRLLQYCTYTKFDKSDKLIQTYLELQ